mgnify:CR=1 FL=1
MFGRRTGKETQAPVRSASTPARIEPAVNPAKEIAKEAPVREPAAAPVQVEGNRRPEYYNLKTLIFNALIEAIDLSQLSRMDIDSAPKEIKDVIGGESPGGGGFFRAGGVGDGEAVGEHGGRIVGLMDGWIIGRGTTPHVVAYSVLRINSWRGVFGGRFHRAGRGA